MWYITTVVNLNQSRDGKSRGDNNNLNNITEKNLGMNWQRS